MQTFSHLASLAIQSLGQFELTSSGFKSHSSKLNIGQCACFAPFRKLYNFFFYFSQLWQYLRACRYWTAGSAEGFYEFSLICPFNILSIGPFVMPFCSELAHYFFLMFYMKLGFIKNRKSWICYFKKNCFLQNGVNAFLA